MQKRVSIGLGPQHSSEAMSKEEWRCCGHRSEKRGSYGKGKQDAVRGCEKYGRWVVLTCSDPHRSRCTQKNQRDLSSRDSCRMMQKRVSDGLGPQHSSVAMSKEERRCGSRRSEKRGSDGKGKQDAARGGEKYGRWVVLTCSDLLRTHRCMVRHLLRPL